MAEDNLLASTPPTPYYAVVFTSCRTAVDDEGYSATAERMLALAAEQDGYLGVESVRDGDGGGITVSYWRDLDAIARWRAATEHRQAQSDGRAKWYEQYRVRVCRVEREYGFGD